MVRRQEKERVKRVFVCSPYRAFDATGQERNTRIAWRLCEKVVQAGHAPFAPHLFYTQFLDDGNATERAAGIACGLAWLSQADEMWVFAHDYEQGTTGMRAEIDAALKCSLPPEIVYMPMAWNAEWQEYDEARREERRRADEAARQRMNLPFAPE